MILSDIIPNFKDTVFTSFCNEKSYIYDKTAYDLFHLDDLDFYRSEQVEFEKLLLSLSSEELESARKEAIAIYSEKRDSSPFGFYYGDFGKSLYRMKKNLEILQKALNNDAQNLKICELGCSVGGWTALWFLHKNAIKPENYTVVDIIPDYCRTLSLFGFKGVPVNLAKEKILPIFDEKYDVIIVTEVVEHMATEQIAFDLIDQAISLLNPGGSIIVSYPRNVGAIVTDVLGHQHQPNKKRINEKFSNSFKETIMDFDGSREFHLFKGYLSTK